MKVEALRRCGDENDWSFAVVTEMIDMTESDMITGYNVYDRDNFKLGLGYGDGDEVPNSAVALVGDAAHPMR